MSTQSLPNLYSAIQISTPTKESLGMGHVDDFRFAAYQMLVLLGHAKSVNEVHDRWEERDQLNGLMRDKPEQYGRLFVVLNKVSSEFILVPTSYTFSCLSDCIEYLKEHHGINYKDKAWTINKVFAFTKSGKGLSRVQDLYECALEIAKPDANGIFSAEHYDAVLDRINRRASFTPECYNKTCSYPRGYHYHKNYEY